MVSISNLIFGRCTNIWTFLVLFSLCFLIETITFTYLITTIQSIERQFQIPSRISGTLAACADIGYMLTAVVLAYFGSKGNRARWIGGGCILISAACFLISVPHYIWPPGAQPINETVLFSRITFTDLLEYQAKFLEAPRPARPTKKANIVTRALQGNDLFGLGDEESFAAHNRTFNASEVTVYDPSLGFIVSSKSRRDVQEKPIRLLFRKSVSTPAPITTTTPRSTTPKKPKPTTTKDPLGDLDASWIPHDKRPRMTRAASLPMAFCNPLINIMKATVRDFKCSIREPNNAALAFIFIGIMLIGVGHSMPWSLGMPFIDDHVPRGNTPIYFGGVFFLRIIGPVLGFLIGGSCFKLYYTLSNPEGITPLDLRWIGAWWFGFLLISLALIIPAIFLFCFPHLEIRKKKRPGQAALPAKFEGGVVTADNRAEKEKKQELNPEPLLPLPPAPSSSRRASAQVAKVKQTVSAELTAFLVSLVVIIKSPVYTAALIGRLFDAFAWKGFFVFLPKYLDNHYGIPQHRAHYIMGGLGILGFATGSLAGAFLMKKLRMEGRKAALFVGVCSALSVLCILIKAFLGCTSVMNQAVATERYPSLLTSSSAEAAERATNHSLRNNINECNQHCGCSDVTIWPVCSESGEPYFSPCHAGCRNITVLNKDLFILNISDCFCTDDGETVSRDYCKHDCHTPVILYFILDLIGGIIGGAAVIPSVLIVLRSVPHDLRSIALGVSAFVVTLISTFPSPIVYGAIIDGTCVKWSDNCGERGNCELYNPVNLRLRTHIFMGSLRVIALIFDIAVWYYAKNLKLMDEPVSTVDDDDERKAKISDANGMHKNAAEDIDGENATTPQTENEEDSAVVEFPEKATELAPQGYVLNA